MPSILLIGLSWSQLPHMPVPPGMTREELGAKLREGLEQTQRDFARANNVDFKWVQVDPAEDFGAVVDVLKNKKWDGVIIGGGIRLVPQFTHLFERLVNAARENAPQATMIFSTRTDNILEAAKRWFPDL